MTTIFSQPNSFNAEIVRESAAISGLEDGKVYVLAARTDLFVDAVKTAIKHFKNLMDNREGLIYHYDISVIENIEFVITSGVLYDAVRNGANIILPISTPNATEKQYIVAKSEAALLDMYIPSMVMQAENLTKKAVEEALMNLASQEPETCNKFLEEIYSNNHLSACIDNCSDVVSLFKMTENFATAIAPVRGLYNAAPSKMTFKKSQEILDRFVVNYKTIIKLEKKSKISSAQEEQLKRAKSEINDVFNMFTPKIYYEFTLQFVKSKNLNYTFDNCINRGKLAKNSNIRISVDSPVANVEDIPDSKTANRLKTNGKFRVYLRKGDRVKQVKFERRTSLVVYVMYLLDRKKRGEDIDTLKISDNESLFCELYAKIYNSTDAISMFNTLKTQFVDGKVKQSRLKDCYQDIRNSLDKTVSEFGESALPFYIPNEYSHITVLSSNISIHETFENVSFRY